MDVRLGLAMVRLLEATNDSLALIKSATWGVRKGWKGDRHSKAGVNTVDLPPLEPETAI